MLIAAYRYLGVSFPQKIVSERTENMLCSSLADQDRLGRERYAT